jgi:hypothetical protein
MVQGCCCGLNDILAIAPTSQNPASPKPDGRADRAQAEGDFIDWNQPGEQRAGGLAHGCAFQWHDDVIELPPDAVHLARSDRCAAQAFRYGEHAYGFQFHLEADGALIERWLDVPQNQAAFADGQVDRQQIRSRIDDSIGSLMTLSNDTFSRWIERFDLQPRKRQLPSR